MPVHVPVSHLDENIVRVHASVVENSSNAYAYDKRIGLIDNLVIYIFAWSY